MELSTIINFLNRELQVDQFEDSAVNGLQVGSQKDIKTIGFAVDATIETFQKAVENECDLLITHHGISWGNDLKSIKGNNFKRVEYLMKNNLALAAYHLPLDAHSLYGNNAQIAAKLMLKRVEQFDLGVKGMLRDETDIQALAANINTSLNTASKVYNYGKNEIRTVAIISGSASRMIEAASKFADVLITGDLSYGSQHIAKELQTNLILAGHYETETAGVQALQVILEKKYGVKTIFIEGDN